MRALFATSWSDDYISAVVWDGLQEVLGEDNVADAGATPSLHSWSDNKGPTARVGGSRPGRCLAHEDGRTYDLLVLHTALLRDRDWGWAQYLRDAHLRPGGRVAVVEGGDHYLEMFVPPFAIDGYFRREIRPGVAYPYPPTHLSFAAPSRWLAGSDNAARTLDVFSACSHFSHPLRWEMLPWVFKTAAKHVSVVASGGVSYEHYFDMLRSAKLALCPPGGADSDCMRFAEVAACGCVPVFLGLPPKVRDPWFGPEHAFFCDTADGLPHLIDAALANGVGPMRERLLAHVREHHTTAVRARKLLQAVGLL